MILVAHLGDHGHPVASLILGRLVPMQAIAQTVLNSNIGGLISHQFNNQQLQIIDGAAIVDDQLHAIIAAIGILLFCALLVEVMT
jgi:hypothetical protein